MSALGLDRRLNKNRAGQAPALGHQNRRLMGIVRVAVSHPQNPKTRTFWILDFGSVEIRVQSFLLLEPSSSTVRDHFAECLSRYPGRNVGKQMKRHRNRSSKWSSLCHLFSPGSGPFRPKNWFRLSSCRLFRRLQVKKKGVILGKPHPDAS